MDMFPLVGEPLALDLVNTRVRAPGNGELDLLGSQEALRRWLAREEGRLTPPPGDVDLDAVRALRGHITQAVEHARHGTAPPARALRALTLAQQAAPAHRELRWDGTAVTAIQRRTGHPTRDLLAELGEAAAGLVAGPSIRKIRRCDGPECQLLFLPAHPGRRWCSPALCGNRARVARYYQRHKD